MHVVWIACPICAGQGKIYKQAADGIHQHAYRCTNCLGVREVMVVQGHPPRPSGPRRPRPAL